MSDLATLMTTTEATNDLSPATESRVDRETGEIIPAPTFPATDVTDWTTDEIDQQLEADQWADEVWHDRTRPTTGLDGKSVPTFIKADTAQIIAALELTIDWYQEQYGRTRVRWPEYAAHWAACRAAAQRTLDRARGAGSES